MKKTFGFAMMAYILTLPLASSHAWYLRIENACTSYPSLYVEIRGDNGRAYTTFPHIKSSETFSKNNMQDLIGGPLGAYIVFPDKTYIQPPIGARCLGGPYTFDLTLTIQNDGSSCKCLPIPCVPYIW